MREGDEGRDGAFADYCGAAGDAVLADDEKGCGGDLLLPLGSDLDYLDEDGDAVLFHGGGAALVHADEVEEDVGRLVDHS